MQESPLRSLFVLLTIALVCSMLVSVSAITLRPIQLQNELIERYRNIVALTGKVPTDSVLADEDVLAVVRELDVRVVNLNTGEFEAGMDPEGVNARAAVNDPTLSVAIETDADVARLGRRAVHEVIYLVWEGDDLSRIILPIHGQGMWSTLFGFIALEADLNTIAALTFYEQAETAGLGDQIEDVAWQARWSGRRLFTGRGDFRFRVAQGPVDDDMPGAEYLVDGLSGATVTANAVSALVEFWFGASGYGPLLAHLAVEPPTRPVSTENGEG
jgi:Na+-transporting NADH:ubiquinone oxidoreductase subunit C